MKPKRLLPLALAALSLSCIREAPERPELPPVQPVSDKPIPQLPAAGATLAFRGPANCYAPRFEWTATEPPRRGPLTLDPNQQSYFVCVKEGNQRCDTSGWSERQRLNGSSAIALGNAVAPHLMWAVRRTDQTRLTVAPPAAGSSAAAFTFAEPTLSPRNSQLKQLTGLQWTVSSCFPSLLGGGVDCVESDPTPISFSTLLGSERVSC